MKGSEIFWSSWSNMERKAEMVFIIFDSSAYFIAENLGPHDY